ncbi:MAG: hypothetical protein M4D80_19275 [Myxococcota bacterium]|nr:hypothetical protein [Myxococcota bacterium]
MLHPAIRLLALSLCAAATAYAEAPKPKSPAPKTPVAKVDPLAGTKMLAPIQVDSLSLTPIIADATATPPTGPRIDVLVLDEAMASKKVRIKEIESESVNNLTFINKSEQPVFILAGEVIIGGKQDRIIGTNTIIPANTTQTVPVFCVEHGRWDNSSKEFTTAKALAHGRLRGKASFTTQSEVWREVAEKNDRRKTKNSTDTYRQVAEQQSNGSLKTWQKKVDEAIAKIPAADRAKMLGYVVALNGKVATVDMFQTPTLFQKLEPKLIKSYVTEAVDIVAQKDVKPPTQKMVVDFIDDAEEAPEEDHYSTKASKSFRKSGAKTGKSSVKLDSADDPASVEKPALYRNYQAK